MRKLLTRGIFSFLCLAVLCLWNSSIALALPNIEDGCLDCHLSGSTIVPETKQFQFGTPWHTTHMGLDPSCVLCHPGSPGATPIPTANCQNCHTTTCPWQDFHTFNQTYNDNVVGVPDDQDNCPDTPNPGQEDTFPPQGNGIGDACDCEGDFNCDGNVDATDVTSFLGDFGRSTFFNPCTTADPCNGDFDCNVNVDAADVTKFLEDFGRSQFFNPCPACVVEPWCTYPTIVEIDIENFRFDADNNDSTQIDTVIINVGDTVRWTWRAGMHTITSGVDSNDPNAGNLFDVPSDMNDQTFSFTFNQAGSFPYFCVFHWLSSDMKGIIEVQ
jgi:plastocyanin